MNFLSFTKFKAYLESSGYILEKGMNIYKDLRFYTYFFSKPGKVDKYAINVYMLEDDSPGDHIMNINKGHGSLYIGWNLVKVDMRKKFWKNFI